MGLTKRPLTPEEAKQVQALSRRPGMTFWAVASKYPECRTEDLRRWWVKDRRQTEWVPTESEMEEAKREVQANWTPELWGRRWVGRYSGVEGADLEKAANRLMPDS